LSPYSTIGSVDAPVERAKWRSGSA